jgi:hypothetical protein
MKLEMPVDIKGFGMEIHKSFLVIEEEGLSFNLEGTFTNKVEAGESFGIYFSMLPPHPQVKTRKWKKWWKFFRGFMFWRGP